MTKTPNSGRPTQPIDAATEEIQKLELTKAETEELEKCESVIRKGWGTFLEVGLALATIRDKKLYKGRYHHFAEYWRKELGISRSYAYNLIGSADVNRQMSSIEDFPAKPSTESQFRELIPVPAAKRVDAWKNAIKLAGDKPITAKIIREATEKYKPRKKAKAKKTTMTLSFNLKPVLDQLAKVEEVAEKNKDNGITKELKALRKLLEELI